MRMTTVKEIEQYLKTVEEPVECLKELEQDQRSGVQKALKRWWTNYEKQQLIRQHHVDKIAFDEAYKPFPKAQLAGVDEAGRGPLAGPVVTAAVILPADCDALIGLDDSKTIQKEQRQALAEKIKRIAVDYAVHIQPAQVIDQVNIYEATKQSMEQVVSQLAIAPDVVVADAMQLRCACPAVSITKADAQSLAVAAASILAKTTRDAYMDELHEQYPMYQFNQHAGYGTKIHLTALEQYGPCAEHRTSFEPIKSMIRKNI